MTATYSLALYGVLEGHDVALTRGGAIFADKNAGTHAVIGGGFGLEDRRLATTA